MKYRLPVLHQQQHLLSDSKILIPIFVKWHLVLLIRISNDSSSLMPYIILLHIRRHYRINVTSDLTSLETQMFISFLWK